MIRAKQAYAMLGNSKLWETATLCHGLLQAAEIPYGICGGVAVCLYGYQRNTVDLDLLIRPNDAAAVNRVLTGAGLVWDEERAEFRTPDGVAVQFLLAGERAGALSEVVLPVPDAPENVRSLEGLSVLSLPKLIEGKIACGVGSLRRTHRDFADVVELIAIQGLDSSFARHLHKSVRKEFKELVRRVRGG